MNAKCRNYSTALIIIFPRFQLKKKSNLHKDHFETSTNICLIHFLRNTRMEIKVSLPRSVGSHTHGHRRCSIGGGNGDVQVVSDLEPLGLQGEGVIWTLPPRHRVADVLHPGIRNRQEMKMRNPHGTGNRETL